MITLHSLREQRATKVDGLKAIHAKAAAETRDLNDAESTAFEAGRGEIEKLDRDIRNAEFLAEAERRTAGEPVTASGGMAELERRFNLGKALGEFAESGRLTGAEAEYAAEHRSGRPNGFAAPVSVFLGESRAVTTTTPAGGPGGNLVPTELGAMIDRNRPLLAVQAMGATVLSGLTGNLDLPQLTASGAASWVAEHTDATGSDPTFAKISLSPNTVTARYEVSRRMLQQASQIESVLRDDIGWLLRAALDSAAIAGTGGTQPLGILNTAGVQTYPMGINGSALTGDTTRDMIALLDQIDATGPTGFLSNTKVKAAALKIKDGQGNYLGLPGVFSNEPATFSNQVPKNLTKGTGTNLSALIYGTWSDLIVAYWSNVDIVLNPYADSVASKGGAYIHAFLDADTAIRHPANFVVAKDVIA